MLISSCLPPSEGQFLEMARQADMIKFWSIYTSSKPDRHSRIALGRSEYD